MVSGKATEDDTATKVFEQIDNAFSEEVEFLRRLVQIATVNPPGKYKEIADFIGSFATEHALEVEKLETPREFCRSIGVESGEPRISVKLTANRRESKPRILLLAHLDTVPTGETSTWKHDPFGAEVRDGRVYGRGACDSKGRIAAYVYSLLALSKVLGVLPSEVSVAATADEEIGGQTGAKYLLEAGKLECDYCIGEGYTWEVYNGFKGLLWVRISIVGTSAHGAAPHLGKSAVKPFADLFSELGQYQERIRAQANNDTTFNIGLVRAGSKINMVPDSARVEIDLRVGGGHSIQQALMDISSIVERLEKSHGDLSFKLEVLSRIEPISISPSHPLVRTLHTAVEEVTKTSIPVGLWFAHSDTLHFLQKGIASVNYGVGRAGVPHTADEYVDLDDLKLSTKAVALAVLRLMSGT